MIWLIRVWFDLDDSVQAYIAYCSNVFIYSFINQEYLKIIKWESKDLYFATKIYFK